MARNHVLEFADLEPVGPGTPSGRYLRLFWQPVMRARDLKSGTAKPFEILGEKFTIYRGGDGTPHVVAFRCPHRGTQLSLGWVEGDTLRCRYHGWRYDGSGQCVEQPNEDRPFCDKVKMPIYPTREYVGLIFAYFGEGEAPPFPRYPLLDQPGVIVTDPIETMPCGFWNRLDNEHSHIPWVHRATLLRKGRNELLFLRRETVVETNYGWKSTRFIKGEKEAITERNGSSHFYMPNVYQFSARTRAKGFEGRNLWDSKFTWTVPVNDGKFAAFDVTNTPLEGKEAETYAKSRYEQQEAEAETRWDLAEKVLAGEMTLEDVPGEMSAYTTFAIEDYTTQVGQGTIRERGPEMLAPTDAKLIVMRRIWLREVSALLEGKPLTQWKIPALNDNSEQPSGRTA
jgi:5,5'-dehydrodivanillate O-demethylase oxygenase subunit